jgi:hypothetical protein
LVSGALERRAADRKIRESATGEDERAERAAADKLDLRSRDSALSFCRRWERAERTRQLPNLAPLLTQSSRR